MPNANDNTATPLESGLEELNRLREQVESGWGVDWRLLAAGALVALLAGIVVWRRVRRAVRRRRPVRLHPRLAQYGGHAEQDPKFLAQRRAQAERIVATSSGAHIVGYDLVEQIEAICVEGFQRPEDALEGLKAVAAMKGANALVNVRTQRFDARRCTAGGDAVVVRRAERVDVQTVHPPSSPPVPQGPPPWAVPVVRPEHQPPRRGGPPAPIEPAEPPQSLSHPDESQSRQLPDPRSGSGRGPRQLPGPQDEPRGRRRPDEP
jgi:hypothetical protein